MNTSGHGRWGRYKQVDGIQHKKCNGPLHPEDGAFLPLRSFWTMKSGPRAGKPLNYCIECEKTTRGRDLTSGLIEISRVWWIFMELRNRLGKTETLRRLGISRNFWMRVERGIYLRMRKETARKAILVLKEVREKNEVRHRDSIRHGAYLRGREEKIPRHRNDFYKPTGDTEVETRRKNRQEQEVRGKVA